MWRWARSDPGSAGQGARALFVNETGPIDTVAQNRIETAHAVAEEEPNPMDASLAQRLQKISKHQLLTLTHLGRKTGNPYKVTIWFMTEGDRLYLASADTRRSWTRNVAVKPNVKLEIGGESFEGTVEPITYPADREHVMRLVQSKYWYALPFILAGRFLQAIGVVKDHSGAFEVKISK